MPTIVRWNGLRIVIYPNDHRPAHVHVIGPDLEAVFLLRCPDGPPEVRGSFGFRLFELNDIAAVLRDKAASGIGFMITDEMRSAAEDSFQTTLRKSPRAVRARYDRRRSSIVIRLDTGLDIVVPTRLVQGLAQAEDAELAEIEISPTGLGLRWPQLDADVYVPGLMEGVFGSRAWMADLPNPAGNASKRSA